MPVLRKAATKKIVDDLQRLIVTNSANMDIVEECQKWEMIFLPVNNPDFEIEVDIEGRKGLLDILNGNQRHIKIQLLPFTEQPEEVGSTEGAPLVFEPDINKYILSSIEGIIPPAEDIITEEEHIAEAAQEHEAVTEPAEKVVAEPPEIGGIFSVMKKQQNLLLDCLETLESERNSKEDTRHYKILDTVMMVHESTVNIQSQINQMQDEYRSMHEKICLIANYVHAHQSLHIPKLFSPPNVLQTIEVKTSND